MNAREKLDALQARLHGTHPDRAKDLRKRIAPLEAKLRQLESAGSYEMASAVYQKLAPLREELAAVGPHVVDSREVVAAEIEVLEENEGGVEWTDADADRLDYLRHDCPAGPGLDRGDDE